MSARRQRRHRSGLGIDKSLLTGDTYTINFQVTPADPTTTRHRVTTYT